MTCELCDHISDKSLRKYFTFSMYIKLLVRSCKTDEFDTLSPIDEVRFLIAFMFKRNLIPFRFHRSFLAFYSILCRWLLFLVESMDFRLFINLVQHFPYRGTIV